MTRIWLLTLGLLFVSSRVLGQDARQVEERPSVAGPVLLTAGGLISGLTALGIGIQQRPNCTDGCRADIPTPYLVTAALAGGAVIAGTVWLIAVLSAGDRSKAKPASTRPCSLELQLAPTLANASLRIAF